MFVIHALYTTYGKIQINGAVVYAEAGKDLFVHVKNETLLSQNKQCCKLCENDQL